MNTVRQGLGGEKIVKEHLESMSYGVSLWELEPKIALSAKMKKKCCIVVDTMAWKIGHFIAGNVWPTLNQDMKKRINMVELGKARKAEFGWCKNN